jgi:hypothetical protein
VRSERNNRKRDQERNQDQDQQEFESCADHQLKPSGPKTGDLQPHIPRSGRSDESRLAIIGRGTRCLVHYYNFSGNPGEHVQDQRGQDSNQE